VGNTCLGCVWCRGARTRHCPPPPLRRVPALPPACAGGWLSPVRPCAGAYGPHPPGHQASAGPDPERGGRGGDSHVSAGRVCAEGHYHHVLCRVRGWALRCSPFPLCPRPPPSCLFLPCPCPGVAVAVRTPAASCNLCNLAATGTCGVLRKRWPHPAGAGSSFGKSGGSPSTMASPICSLRCGGGGGGAGWCVCVDRGCPGHCYSCALDAPPPHYDTLPSSCSRRCPSPWCLTTIVCVGV
jgi:hypothetical protein